MKHIIAWLKQLIKKDEFYTDGFHDFNGTLYLVSVLRESNIDVSTFTGDTKDFKSVLIETYCMRIKYGKDKNRKTQ